MNAEPVSGLCPLYCVVCCQLWIVFYDEGLSLRKYLYTPTRADGVILYEPSEFWKRMR